MHRLAIKRYTKKRSATKSQYTCNGVFTAASRHSAIRCERRYVCRDCRVPTALKSNQIKSLHCTRRGVRTANLHAVRSAITATAELLVFTVMLPFTVNKDVYIYNSIVRSVKCRPHADFRHLLTRCLNPWPFLSFHFKPANRSKTFRRRNISDVCTLLGGRHRQ